MMANASVMLIPKPKPLFSNLYYHPMNQQDNSSATALINNVGALLDCKKPKEEEIKSRESSSSLKDEKADKETLFTLKLSLVRVAVHQVQVALKLTFEPALSRAIEQRAAQEPNEVTGSDLPSTSSFHQLDTHQICNTLIQWCIEGSDKIPSIFEWNERVCSVTPNSKEEIFTSESVRSHRSGDSAQSSRNQMEVQTRSLCKYILEHTERIAEFRDLIAHNLLSITAQECKFVLGSINTVLRSLKDRSLGVKDVRSVLESPLEIENDKGKNAQILNLREERANLLLTLEMLYTLEETVVKAFRSLPQGVLQAEVVCVASLCSLLKNEALVAEITKAVGCSPKHLLNKSMSAESSSGGIIKGKMSSLKQHSHLDVVHLARNAFNHIPFEHITLSTVCQWLTSALEVVRAFHFPPQRDFTAAIAHLTLLCTTMSCPSFDFLKVTWSDQGKPEKDMETQTSPEATLTQKKVRLRKKTVVRLLKKRASKCFVGRTGILDRIAEITSTVSCDPRVIVLSGHPGFGKSYLALKAAHRHEAARHFQVHFWITATTRELLQSGLVSLLNASGGAVVADMKMPMQRLVILAQKMSRTLSCFLVVDDVTLATASEVRELVTAFDPQGVIIVTTCLKELDVPSYCEQFEVEALTIDQCFELLEVIVLGTTLPRPLNLPARQARHRLWEEICLAEENRSIMEQLVVSQLGCSPLGVSLLGQLLVSEMCLHTVLEKFFDTEIESLEALATTRNNKHLFAQQHSGLEITIHYLLDPLRSNKKLLSLLYALSLFSANGIPIRLVKPFLQTDFESQKPCHLSLPSSQRESLPTTDYLSILEGLRLIQIHSPAHSTKGNGTSYILVHQLTQTALRHLLPKFFDIQPLEVCQTIVQGFWEDLHLDHFVGVRLGQSFFSVEEALKWADSILFSKFARQLALLAQDGDASVYSVARELQSRLIVACCLLIDLSPQHLRTVYSQLLVHYADPKTAVQSSSNAGGMVGDIFLCLRPSQNETSLSLEMTEEAFLRVWDDCVRQDLYIEYASFFLCKVLQFTGRPRLVSTLVSSVEKFFASRPETANADLENLYLGLKCDLGWAMMSWEGKADQTERFMAEVAQSLAKEKKYFGSTKRLCLYTKAGAIDLQTRFEESVSIYEALIEEYRECGDLRCMSNTIRAAAKVYMLLDRPQDALPLLQSDLEHTLEQCQDTNQQAVAHCFALLASCYCLLDQYEASEQHYLEFELIRDKRGDKHAIGHMWNVCSLYSRWGKYNLAVSWARLRWAQIGGIENGIWAYLVARDNMLGQLFALGPHKALIELRKLGIELEDPVLLSHLREFKSLPNVTVMIWTLISRAYFWRGEYQNAWGAIQEALEMKAHLDATHDAGTIAHVKWQFAVQYITCAIEQMVSADRTITENPLKGAAFCVDQIPVQGANLLHTLLRDCVNGARKFLTEMDIGWHFEYAQLLLRVVKYKEENILESLSAVSQTCQDLQREAVEILHLITTAQVDVTEWSTLAMELLQNAIDS